MTDIVTLDKEMIEVNYDKTNFFYDIRVSKLQQRQSEEASESTTNNPYTRIVL